MIIFLRIEFVLYSTARVNSFGFLSAIPNFFFHNYLNKEYISLGLTFLLPFPSVFSQTSNTHSTCFLSLTDFTLHIYKNKTSLVYIAVCQEML